MPNNYFSLSYFQKRLDLTHRCVHLFSFKKVYEIDPSTMSIFSLHSNFIALKPLDLAMYICFSEIRGCKYFVLAHRANVLIVHNSCNNKTHTLLNI